MEALAQALEKILSEGIYKIVVSNPIQKSENHQKIVINRIQDAYQAEKFTQKQVFHENIPADALQCYLETLLCDRYAQCNAWSDSYEFSLRISKKGKLLFAKKATAGTPPIQKPSHNRQKNYLLKEGEIIPPLVDLGIFTKEGKVVNAMYDKYKQLNRFLEILDDEVSKTKLSSPVRIIDFGCGKSYLTFVVYYYFTRIKNIEVAMTGLDLKADVIAACNQTAQAYGYHGLRFEVGDIADYQSDEPVDIVISLHACDTATDLALFNALRWNAKLIFSVPCCQHELNAQIASDDFSILTEYGIIKERVSALFTDAIRANLLEHCGYKTQLLEFIDFAHTPKNILIRAKKVRPVARGTGQHLAEVERLMREFSLDPTFYRLLRENSYLPSAQNEE